jgi:hypothetical protein
LVNFKTIDLGEVKVPVFKNPKDLSVAVAVTPLAQLMVPPLDDDVTAPVPVVPKAKVVAVVPVDQSVPILNPVGSVAVPLLPIESKFWGNAVPVLVILICPAAMPLIRARQDSNATIKPICFIGP